MSNEDLLKLAEEAIRTRPANKDMTSNRSIDISLRALAASQLVLARKSTKDVISGPLPEITLKDIKKQTYNPTGGII